MNEYFLLPIPFLVPLKLPNQEIDFPFPPLKLQNEENNILKLFFSFLSILFSPPKRELRMMFKWRLCSKPPMTRE